MSAWLKRFGLHLAAAIGATGVFVAAAAVGANQTRQQVAAVRPVQVVGSPTPRAPRKPTVEVAGTPSPAPDVTQSQPSPTPAQTPPRANPGPARPRPTQAQPGSTDIPPNQADTQQDQTNSAPGAQTPPGAQPPVAPAAAAGATAAPAPAGPAGQPAVKPSPPPRRTPTPTTAPAAAGPQTPSTSTPVPTPEKVAPERSLAGTIQDVQPDGLDVLGVGGREWRVTPAPGALIRLNGKTVRLDALQVGDAVVILGQAQPGKDGPLFRFLSHAITARRK